MDKTSTAWIPIGWILIGEAFLPALMLAGVVSAAVEGPELLTMAGYLAFPPVTLVVGGLNTVLGCVFAGLGSWKNGMPVLIALLWGVFVWAVAWLISSVVFVFGIYPEM